MDRDRVLARLRAVSIPQRVITALDYGTAVAALEAAGRLGHGSRFLKVGLELFSAAGPPVITALRQLGQEVFLDLKYHDIPNTVAGAVRAAAGLNVAMLTVHASAGRRVLTAAVNTLQQYEGTQGRPALLAVTVLTSLSVGELQEMSPQETTVRDRVLRLAALAWECGCDGLVCAPPDLPPLRQQLGPRPLVVTPGIRPADALPDDQRRTATAASAMAAGADYLVIGRPITGANDPAAAWNAFSRELEG